MQQLYVQRAEFFTLQILRTSTKVDTEVEGRMRQRKEAESFNQHPREQKIMENRGLLEARRFG